MSSSRRWHVLLVIGAILIWLLLIASIHPVSHDESQYVAATYLVAHGLTLYRDFAYLQTPLQPVLFSPLAFLFKGHLFAASRFMNALLGALTAAAVYFTSRRAGASSRASLMAAALLVTCHAFVWAAGVARNDMLPTMLLSGSLWLLVGTKNNYTDVAAGFAAGLAISCKISFALPTLGILAARFSQSSIAPAARLAFLIGLVGGVLPTVLMAMAAPQAFGFEVVTFGMKAPTIWYTELGERWMLGPVRFANLLLQSAMGPALTALVLVVAEACRAPRDWLHSADRRMLAAATAGGLLSAALIRPFNSPYLVPALPPLFVLLAVSADGSRGASVTRKALLGLSALVGLAFPAIWIGNLIADGEFEVAKIERRTRDVGDALRAHRVAGQVAWLSTEYLVDSGFSPDPRFATGPFLFRTVGLVNAEDARAWHIVTRDQIGTLAQSPPGAIIVGGEENRSVKPDVRLAAYAKDIGFRPVTAVEKYSVWMRAR